MAINDIESRFVDASGVNLFLPAYFCFDNVPDSWLRPLRTRGLSGPLPACFHTTYFSGHQRAVAI